MQYTCRKCGEIKPLSAFNRSKSTATGHDYRCRECRRSYKVANRETIRASAQTYTQRRASAAPVNTYRRMIERCYNETAKGYQQYGARGIRVCDDWLNSRQEFYSWALKNGWTPGLLLDRINIDLDFKPSNCQWVSRKDCINKINEKRWGYDTYKGYNE